jgi:tRNA pseudouridine synthase 10
MNPTAWRNVPLEDALERPEQAERARRALARGRLCDACLGRLFAEVDTGLTNAARGRIIRKRIGEQGLPPAPRKRQATCSVCRGLFDEIEAWARRCRDALGDLQFDTLLVTSRTDPAIVESEKALWDSVGAGLAEPYKQAFNREVGGRLCEDLDVEPDFAHPDVVLVADHAAGTVAAEPRPLFVRGRYRKLVRGIPQCRWAAWPTSVQEIVAGPLMAAAGGEDHLFHGCGREDVDVRCLGERPFVLEIVRPRRRRLDWPVLQETVNRDGRVEIAGLDRCGPGAAAEVKALRPDKTYRALVHLSESVEEGGLEVLDKLCGPIRQRTPRRVAGRRANRVRCRRVRELGWKPLGGKAVELTVRAQAGLYIKELVSGDASRTRPSAAELLGVEAQCAELDVVAIHINS